MGGADSKVTFKEKLNQFVHGKVEIDDNVVSLNNRSDGLRIVCFSIGILCFVLHFKWN